MDYADGLAEWLEPEARETYERLQDRVYELMFRVGKQRETIDELRGAMEKVEVVLETMLGEPWPVPRLAPRLHRLLAVAQASLGKHRGDPW